MSSSITVSVRSLVVAAVAVLALVTAYLLGAGGGGAQAASAAAPATGGSSLARTVTMTGEGEVTAVPDQLSFQVSVTRTADDVATALDQSTATLERVLAALDRLGVLRKDTQSTGLSIDPVYRYFDDEPPQITGYRVRQSLSVMVRELRTGGRAVAAAVEAGGNAVRISGIRLEIGDREALLGEARDAAVEAATAKAEQYAAATGQSLGDVLTLQEGSRPAKVTRDGLAGLELAYDRASAQAIPVRAGRQDLSVSVSIVWRLT